MEKLTRRYEDKTIVKWKNTVALVSVGAFSYLGGAIVGGHAPYEVKMVVTSFVGGILAISALWNRLGKEAIGNMEDVSRSRGEKIEMMEKALQEQTEIFERRYQEAEDRHRREISDMEGKFKTEMDAMRAKVTQLEDNYRATITENVILRQKLELKLTEPIDPTLP